MLVLLSLIPADELAALHSELEQVKGERDAMREALKLMSSHFGLTEAEMAPQLPFMSKKAVTAIRATNAALKDAK